ncbi:MAG: hypothetical protein LBR15_05880 [Methanobrevibacter sp.]|jgi:hypothetical protein|nr:hypothetical protein [Candidatus Methanovirga australis]
MREETKLKLSKALTGHKVSEETRLKMAISSGKLDIEDVRAIRKAVNEGVSYDILAKKYNVHYNTIYRLIKGITYYYID